MNDVHRRPAEIVLDESSNQLKLRVPKLRLDSIGREIGKRCKSLK
jgi:hypothetical protein